jgi:hypothetical protein
MYSSCSTEEDELLAPKRLRLARKGEESGRNASSRLADQPPFFRANTLRGVSLFKPEILKVGVYATFSVRDNCPADFCLLRFCPV